MAVVKQAELGIPLAELTCKVGIVSFQYMLDK